MPYSHCFLIIENWKSYLYIASSENKTTSSVYCVHVSLFPIPIHAGLKPPPPYSAQTTGLSLSQTSSAASGLTGLTSKLTTTATPGVGLGVGLPKPAAASTIKPGLTGLMTAATTASTGLTSSAASGAAGGGSSGKKYTYKELENLVNKVRKVWLWAGLRIKGYPK